MVNPLNVTDQLFRRTDITGASDAAVFAELAGNQSSSVAAMMNSPFVLFGGYGGFRGLFPAGLTPYMHKLRPVFVSRVAGN
jgi:hypothetical protein